MLFEKEYSFYFSEWLRRMTIADTLFDLIANYSYLKKRVLRKVIIFHSQPKESNKTES